MSCLFGCKYMKIARAELDIRANFHKKWSPVVVSWTGLSSWERGKSGGEVKRNCWEKIALPCLPSASDQISWNPRLGFKATLFRLLSSAIWNKLSQMTTNKAGGIRLTSSAEQNFEDLWDILASFTNCRNLSFSCTLSVFLIFRSVLLRGKCKGQECQRAGRRSLGVARKSFAWLATICLGIHLEMSPKIPHRLQFTVIPLFQCSSITITKANVWVSL